MNIERGATNHLIVTGRETIDAPYYLLVFQQVVNKSNYEYVVAQNSGSSTGPLILEILETDNADPFDAEVTLGTGDWHMAVYEQSDPENLDASLAGRRVTSELVRVVSDSTDEPVYPPDPCAGTCDDGEVENSDATYTATVASGGTLVLPDVTHTDSDGSPTVLPGMTAMVCTPSVGSVDDFYYSIAIGHP